jgi:hypothetical protein
MMKESAGVILDPSSEGMPQGGFTNGHAGLLNDDEENAGSERGAVDFASGPEVVGNQCKQEKVRENAVYWIIALAESQGKARDGSDEDRCSGEEDIAFVRGGIYAATKGEIDEGAEEKHVREWDDVKSSWVASGNIVPS